MSTQTHLQENNNNSQHDQTIIQRQIQEYVEEKKELYNNLTLFLEDSENDDQNFKKMNDFISTHQENTNKEDFENFLHLITDISNNHHRESIFFSKIFKIIQNYQDKIKQTFSNIEIYSIFQSNKRILLFLFESKIITVDDRIYLELTNKSDANGCRYCHFFYPEVKEFIGDERSKEIMKDILSKDPNIFDRFNEKRHEGENDTYICNLIRRDSIEEFVSYVNQANIPLKGRINPSIFETNSFLCQTSPTLIEYSAFFGSLQVFQYLRMNEVELTPSLWLYAIHSDNAELIHILEAYKVDPPIIKKENNDDDDEVKNDECDRYEKCFIEAIICHHNNFADYIRDNLMNQCSDDVSQYVLKSRNYQFFQNDFSLRNDLFYLCSYNYNKLVDLLIKKNEKEIKKTVNDLITNDILYIAARENQIEFVYYLLLNQEKVDDNCFRQNSILKKIAIPPTIKSIGREAFADCISLEQIFIPSSVVEIGVRCFNGCQKLKSIEIPPSITRIEKEAFKGCISLEQITIPITVTSIEESSFSNCENLVHVEIPASVTSIGRSCFNGCSKLTSVIIPPSITRIEKGTFKYCKSLEHVKLPTTVKSIEDKIFYECENLERIEIPSVTSIGNWSFAKCSSLKQVLISSSATSIGYCAFAGCSSLEQIEIPSSVTMIDDCAFSECSSLQKITIPSSVTRIGNSTFSACSSLQQVTIPSTVTSIGNCSFYECTSLTKISIPSSVTQIGICAFFGCSSLVDISLPQSLTEIGFDAFLQCTSLQNTSHSYLVNKEPFTNIDDYEINELVGVGSFGIFFKATNKKTKQVVLLRSYDTIAFRNYQTFLHRVIVTNINVPGVINIQSYRRPLTDPEKDQTKTKSFTAIYRGKKQKFDLTNYIAISDFMKNSDVSKANEIYLDIKTADEKMNPTIRSKIIFGVAAIMKHLHKNGIINRDLKLRNILLDDNLEPRICLASLSDFITHPLNLDFAVGTPYCMAPEVFMDDCDMYSFPVDVYSYAFVVYQMFSNKIEFSDNSRIRSPQQFMLKISRGLRPKRPENIPDHYWELIQRCWQINPDDRPTFEEITNILKDDKYALEEFGMKTDLNQLHEYQQRIDNDAKSNLI